jgi:hypothetical protein
MTSAQAFKWPSLGRKDADKHAHADFLLKETRQLKAACNSTKGGKKAKAIPSGIATPLLDSIIEWFNRPDVVNDGQDALWKALQQMQQDLAAQHKQQNITLHKLLSKGSTPSPEGPRPRSYAAAAVAGGATPDTGRATPTGTYTTGSTARVLQIDSLRAKEIRVTITDPKLKTELRALAKPAEHILSKANSAIIATLGPHTSHDHNNGARTSASRIATPNWIESARLMPSGDVFLYAHKATAVEKILLYKTGWEHFLGAGTEAVTPTWGVILSSILITSIDMADQAAAAEKLYAANPGLLFSVHSIKRITWLSKAKPGKETNAIVVNFNSVEIADAFIRAGKAIWEGAPKST